MRLEMLALPKIVALDSSTLVKISSDYWSKDANLREKARKFLSELKENGVFVAFTAHHISELLRHERQSIVDERLSFFQKLELIAWIRPYNREWFPGLITDILSYELEYARNQKVPDWVCIINQVRGDLWETGVGYDIFVNDDRLWFCLREESIHLLEKEKQISSIDRTTPEEIKKLTVGDVKKMSILPKEKRGARLRQFIESVRRELELHGDKRLTNTLGVARDFSIRVFEGIDFNGIGEEIITQLLKIKGVPEGCVVDNMTLGDLGELAIFAKRLKDILCNMNLQHNITVRDIPINALPSYAIERKLASIQRKAQKVSGSDFGDRHMVPLVFYADAVEVDKRTWEYLNQIKRDDAQLASLIGDSYFKSEDYGQISLSEF
jgi:hypothetical protein